MTAETSAEPAAPVYSVVAPVLNEEELLPGFYRRLAQAAAELDAEAEFIFVDDGSRDRSREVLLELRRSDPRVKLVALSRNFGHQMAITAGLDLARGEAVAIIDSDLQDPPELIPEMAKLWRQGFDVVYATRTERRGESSFKLRTAHLFYRLLNRASNVDLPVDAGDFRLVDRRVAEIVRTMREPSRYMRGMFAWVGFKQTGVPYEREERAAGDSKFSLAHMLRLATDGLISFSTVPLRLALGLGFLISLLAFAAGITAAALKLGGVYAIPGWASVTVMLSFFSGVQLLVLGAVGQYVGRIYEQGMGRPLYLIAETHGFTPERASEPRRALTPPRETV